MSLYALSKLLSSQAKQIMQFDNLLKLNGCQGSGLGSGLGALRQMPSALGALQLKRGHKFTYRFEVPQCHNPFLVVMNSATCFGAISSSPSMGPCLPYEPASLQISSVIRHLTVLFTLYDLGDWL